MKKLLALILMVLGIGCLPLNSWAGEASVFHHNENWLIRAYYEDNGIIKLEVRGTNNMLITDRSIEGLGSNPETLADDATSEDVSLAFDELTSTAYVFYTTSSGLQLSKKIIRSFLSISASPQSVTFGSVNVGVSSTQTVTITNRGTSTVGLTNISVTGMGFSKSGGTCTNSLTANANCTVIVQFQPASTGTFSGSLAINSTGGNLNVPLSGTGQQVSGSGVDLLFTSVTAPKGGENGLAFSITMTIQNAGSASSGPFKVKGYFSVDTIPGNGGTPADQLLFTWDVSNLGAGATATNTFSNLKFTGFPIHSTAYIVIKVDADNQVAETNESNNIVTRSVTIAR